LIWVIGLSAVTIGAKSIDSYLKMYTGTFSEGAQLFYLKSKLSAVFGQKALYTFSYSANLPAF
jgi:hypothetical protein